MELADFVSRFAVVLTSVTLLSAVSTFVLVTVARRLGIMDVPNHRSLHSIPRPRTGGLAVVLAAIAGLFYLSKQLDSELVSILPYGLVILLLAFIDDMRSISSSLRLLVQFVVAMMLVFKGLALTAISLPGIEIILHKPVSIVVSVIFIVWTVNMYNFMDGMDGFAGGMALIGFTSFAIIAFYRGDSSFALINLLVVAATLGFLVFNLPPAKIFLGDVGSTLLGMFVAFFILWADLNQVFPFWIGLIIFMPFFLDATVTLVKRIARKEKFWEAHRTHYYQRLVLSGVGNKKTLLLVYLLMILSSVVGILLVLFMDTAAMQWGILLLFILFSGMILFLVDTKLKK